MLQSTRCRQSLVPVSCSVGFSPLSVIRSRKCRSATLPLPLSSERRTFVCQAESQTPKEPSTAEGVLDYALGQGIYQIVGAAMAVLSLAYIFATPQLAEKFYGLSVLPVGELLFRETGAVAFIPLAMSLSLQSAVESNRLDSPTYKRMSFTLAFALLLMIIMKMIYLYKTASTGAIGFWITSVVQVLPTVAFLKLYGFSIMSEIIPGFIAGVTSLFEADNINSALYSIFAVITMLIALASIVKPDVIATWFLTQSIDGFGKLLMRNAGGLVFLLSIVCFTLKDSADRDRLGFTTFRNLNIATFLTSVAKIGVSLFVNKKVIDAAATATTTAAKTAAKGNAKTAVQAVPEALFTKNGLIALLVIFGGLALLSGYNAITAKKE